MARTKTNKSAAIKEALKANPGKGPKEIAELVSQGGTKVTATYVSNVKATMGKGKKKGKRGRPKTVTSNGVGVSHGRQGFAAVEDTIVFVKGVGGLDQAKKLIALLEKARGV